MPLEISRLTERTFVTDGAWGTQMQNLGLPAGACPELWNVENPDAVKQVARSYVQAGSDIILTNTFGSNAFVLARHGEADRAAELAEAGAAISRAAAGDAAMVFGSMGPTGKIVMMGEVAEEEIYRAFADQAAALARGGADAIICETMTEPAEVALAVRAVREQTDLPVLVSLTYDSGPNKDATMMGATPAKVVEQIAADGYGANCGVGPERYVQIARLYRDVSAAPVWVKANAGLPQVVDGQTTFPLGPEAFAAFVPQLIEAGANCIGGCCGTTPEHIAAVRNVVDEL